MKLIKTSLALFAAASLPVNARLNKPADQPLLADILPVAKTTAAPTLFMSCIKATSARETRRCIDMHGKHVYLKHLEPIKNFWAGGASRSTPVLSTLKNMVLMDLLGILRPEVEVAHGKNLALHADNLDLIEVTHGDDDLVLLSKELAGFQAFEDISHASKEWSSDLKAKYLAAMLLIDDLTFSNVGHVDGRLAIIDFDSTYHTTAENVCQPFFNLKSQYPVLLQSELRHLTKGDVLDGCDLIEDILMQSYEALHEAFSNIYEREGEHVLNVFMMTSREKIDHVREYLALEVDGPRDTVLNEEQGEFGPPSNHPDVSCIRRSEDFLHAGTEALHRLESEAFVTMEETVKASLSMEGEL